MPSHAEKSLGRKLGQLIILGFKGQFVPDRILEDLATRNLGGIVLTTANENLGSPAQIQKVLRQIREVSKTPPFLAIDQEGGKVARLNATNGFSSTSSAYHLGTTAGSLDATRAQAGLMASWLQSCGFNMNLAPVADVNVNPLSPTIGLPQRSYSVDPLSVAAHDRAFIEEFHKRKIITVLKHFPGHGSAGTDSHVTLPDITTSWTDTELIPYRELLNGGCVDMVMIGHLYNAALDDTFPSSLSRATIQGLLRDSLGFRGVAITDDLHNMMAITANFGYWDAAEHAINAGVDILLYGSNEADSFPLCSQLINVLESKVRHGIIAESRIDEAYNRIQQLKNRYAFEA